MILGTKTCSHPKQIESPLLIVVMLMPTQTAKPTGVKKYVNPHPTAVDITSKQRQNRPKAHLNVIHYL